MEQQGELYQKEGENANGRRRDGWRRLPVLMLALILITAIVVGAYLLWGNSRTLPQATVRRGSIRGTVLASGEVVSARESLLTSQVSGQVSAVPLEVGEEVVSGTLLVAIEVETLRFRVERAQSNVEIARLRLAQGEEQASAQELALAQLELDVAEARLAALGTESLSEEIAIAQQEVALAQTALDQAKQELPVAVEWARLNWEAAVLSLRDAQQTHNQLYKENEQQRQAGQPPSQSQQDAETSAWRRVTDAEEAAFQSRLTYEQVLQEQPRGVITAQVLLAQAGRRLGELLNTPGADTLLQTQAQVARARANLEALKAGADEKQLQILREELHLAELSLAEAQSDLDKAVVRAPFSGTVVELAVEEGEFVGTFSPLVRLADLGQLQIEARIDEIDVGQVAPGQAVTVTLDAFPGQPLRGYVQDIAPAVTVERGSAFYRTKIAFTDRPTLTLRLGMAANLTIVTLEKDDVLLVPRQAVERVGAGYYVTVLRGSRRERVQVSLGVADPLNYEVLSGLQEGDRVLLP